MTQSINSYGSQNMAPAMQQPIQQGQSGNVVPMYPSNADGVRNWITSQPVPTQQQVMPTGNTQGWKMYTPVQNKPVIGRWVSDFEEIKPMDVPMDGSFAIFPQMDRYGNMSCIYAMVWGSDGTIKPYRFLPEMITSDTSDQHHQPDPIKEILTGFTASMNTRMDALERRIGDILTPFTNQPKSTKRTTIKESDAT